MKLAKWLTTVCMALITSALAWADQSVVEKRTVPFEQLPRHVDAEIFDIGFLVGDSNYHSILAASDGRIHFTVDTHDDAYGSRYYTFDPNTGVMNLVAKMDEVLGEPASTHIPQGKVHTPLFEHEGKVYFATHTAYYAGEVPRRDTGGKVPYSGGRFVCYDLASGQFTDLARSLPGEGIITMAMDKANEMLYGLTWPSGLLLAYDIKGGEMRCWGAVQGRGEWGHHPDEWDRICRTLAVAPDGRVYGTTMDGRLWRFDARDERPVTYLDGLDLSKVPFTQSAAATLKGDFQNNWRVIEWNNATKSFWGLHFETATLFEFIPDSGYIRAVVEMRPEPYRGMPRNPEISQLGFILGPKNTLLYLANGPAVAMAGRPPLQSAVYLLTWDIDKEVLTDYGPVIGPDHRRLFFTESLARAQDGRLYTVAWAEVLDPARAEAIRGARRVGPAETARDIYEIVLARLPGLG